MTRSSHNYADSCPSSLGLRSVVRGPTYSRPGRSTARRRSPGGANDSVSPEACSFRQAAFFSGEHPQWAESGFPPQLPARRLPLSITPMAMRLIRAANAKMVTRRVASTSRDLAASPEKASVTQARVTKPRRSGDSRQNSSLFIKTMQRGGRLMFLACSRNFYVGVTGASLARLAATRASNRYGEVIVGSRSLARGLVLGAPSTQ